MNAWGTGRLSLIKDIRILVEHLTQFAQFAQFTMHPPNLSPCPVLTIDIMKGKTYTRNKILIKISEKAMIRKSIHAR